MKILNMVIPILMYYLTFTHRSHSTLAPNISFVKDVKPLHCQSQAFSLMSLDFPTVYCRIYYCKLLILTNQMSRYIEDIYFFEVNNKYISSSVLKASEFSQVRSTSENSMFSTHKMKYIWYLPKKNNSFYFILFRRFTVNQVMVFRTKIQRIVCDRIPGSIKL